MSKPEQGAALFGHEFDFDQGTARRQIGPALPSPSERDAAMWYDFCINSTRKVPGADLDAKNTPGAGIEGMLLAEPARHEAGSTKTRKTASGDAAMKISRLISGTRFIAASTSVLFFLPPVSTATIHHPRTP